MTFPTTDLRLGYSAVGLLAKRSDLHAPLKDGSQWPRYSSAQLQEFTCVRL